MNEPVPTLDSATDPYNYNTSNRAAAEYLQNWPPGAGGDPPLNKIK